MAPVRNSVGNTKIANDFARAFADAQYIVSQRAHKSWLWPLFELWGDETAEPMKVVNAYIEPILKDAVEKAKTAALDVEKPIPESFDEDTLLDHLIRLTTGRRFLLCHSS